MRSRLIAFGIIFFAALNLTACNQNQGGNGGGDTSAPVTLSYMEEKPVIDYTVPESTPNILVDTTGYQIGMDNRAIVRGSEIPDTFCIVDADTKEVVYKGLVISSKYPKTDGYNLSYCDFGDFDKAGTYYIECEDLGQSERFELKKELYSEKFEDCISSFIKNCQDKTVSVTDIYNVCTAYTWYPEAFEDSNEDAIPDALFGISEYFDGLLEDKDYSYTMDEAAILADFCFIYQTYDRQKSLEYLAKATEIYNQNKESLHTDSADFWALVELYRATGKREYGNQIKAQLSYFQNNSSFLEDTNYLHAAETYMFTRQSVSLELCNIFMDSVRKNAEEVADRYEDIIAPIHAKNNGIAEINKRCEDILYSNYVMPNYLYNNILADFLHYIGGVNYDSANLTEETDSLDYLLVYAQLANIKLYQGTN